MTDPAQSTWLRIGSEHRTKKVIDDGLMIRMEICHLIMNSNRLECPSSLLPSLYLQLAGGGAELRATRGAELRATRGLLHIAHTQPWGTDG